MTEKTNKRKHLIFEVIWTLRGLAHFNHGMKQGSRQEVVVLER